MSSKLRERPIELLINCEFITYIVMQTIRIQDSGFSALTVSLLRRKWKGSMPAACYMYTRASEVAGSSIITK